jgi:hypothetical protein
MKRTVSIMFWVVALTLLCSFASAQPAQWAGAGLQWNQEASPQISGMAVFARRIIGESHPTYSFSLININSVKINSWKPFDAHVQVSTETGLAQHIMRFGVFDVYALGTLGMTSTGVNTGFSYSGGGTAQAGLGKGWSLGPSLRVFKSAIAGPGYAAGILGGWGK